MKVILIMVIVFCGCKNGWTQGRKVLIVSTNTDSIRNQPNGTFLMEIAYPVAAFTKAGIEVDILTPKGGKVPVYTSGALSQDLASIQQSELFRHKINHSLAPHQVVVAGYGGIFYPGGGGQFYDVFNNDSIARIAAVIYEAGGVVGSAGHGAVSLINIRLRDSSFLVANKSITCFPKYASANWLPVDWEMELARRGARVVLPVTPDEKDKGVQLADNKNRIISGSYAENAQWVAEKMTMLIKNK